MATKRWSGTDTANVTATISGAITLGAGSASVGAVTVALATSAFQGTGTVTTAGTRVTLGSNGSLVYGFYVTNTHATATVFVGTTAAVSSTAFIFRLAPGQSTPLIPLTNSNLVAIDADTSGATVSFGGF